jgi:pre-rRNA-processing protein TSR1
VSKGTQLTPLIRCCRRHRSQFDYAGKLNRQPVKTSGSPTAAQSRLNRKNHAKQVQVQKRQAVVSATRLFNGADGVPRIVAIVPLTPDVDAASVASALGDPLDISEEVPGQGLYKLKYVISICTKTVFLI